MPLIGQSLPDSKILAHGLQLPGKPQERILVMLIGEPLGSGGSHPDFPRRPSFAQRTSTCWPSWPPILCFVVPSPPVPRLRYA
jgi:hypothetical protein